jgi:hypothetical protein
MPQIGKVFVSHASADKPFVDQLVADLAARSIPVWYDKLDLRVGESVPGAINAGLSDSKYFAIVLSKASVASSWVREELNAALMTQVAKGGTFILPLLLQDCAIPRFSLIASTPTFGPTTPRPCLNCLDYGGRTPTPALSRARPPYTLGLMSICLIRSSSTCTRRALTNSSE